MPRQRHLQKKKTLQKILKRKCQFHRKKKLISKEEQNCQKQLWNIIYLETEIKKSVNTEMNNVSELVDTSSNTIKEMGTAIETKKIKKFPIKF